MRSASLVLASCALMALAACRLEEPREAVSPGAPPGESSSEATEEPERLSAATPELRGFDLVGAGACLPLAADRRCLARPDAVREACLAKKGELLTCEDCRVLCSVALGK